MAEASRVARGREGLQAWFADYVRGFYGADPELRRVARMKERHTARVCMAARRLGAALGMPPRELFLVESMALLHDVGRFPQFAAYRTFRDQDSENHAKLGLRVISRHRLLRAFDPEERRHIARAVAYHNAARMPELPDRRSLGYLKLLRDADKLDILRVMIGHYGTRRVERQVLSEFDVTTAGAGCSPSVVAALNQGRTVPLAETRTADDVRLLYISWVFDLNYKAAFLEVRRGGYLERLAAPLPEVTSVRTALQRARDHLARHAG